MLKVSLISNGLLPASTSRTSNGLEDGLTMVAFTLGVPLMLAFTVGVPLILAATFPSPATACWPP